ncbi:uncharacterized protein LOC108033429 isoform X2 [Drosophila biarmipes]|uniref:uncharacterized protein LOC108033429 isoform X2 n=1 Tax=Drosophila biarmipes TaxID=125945 RepID=UPI0007E5C096|nr:uncharacterized protein LOC108033429 isoform X2 [Drosophila biarmipes]
MSHKKTKHEEGINRVSIRESLSDPWIIPFPLPEHKDPSLCRDEFLSHLIRKHESRAESLRPRSTIKRETLIPGAVEEEDEEVQKGAEAMVVWQLAKQRQAGPQRKTVEEVLASIRMRSTLLMALNYQCQKAAIEFLSVRLLKQLRLFSSPWPGELEEVPHDLFSWSLDDFMKRLNIKQIYLEVLRKERSVEDLDCVKFCRDLSEMELLIYEIRKDYREDEDLCQNSIQLLRKYLYLFSEMPNTTRMLPGSIPSKQTCKIWTTVSLNRRLLIAEASLRWIFVNHRLWGTLKMQRPSIPSRCVTKSTGYEAVRISV